MMMPQNPKLICIVGAGRSGTTFVARSLASALPARDIGENRYLWSYGQRDRRNDVRLESEASTAVRQRINAHLQQFGPDSKTLLIDHTPSNAFRIPLISAIFSDVKFIHIVRDGRDNVLSRLKQWQRPWIGPRQGQGSSERSRRALQPFRDIRPALIEFQRLRRNGNLPVDTWLPAAWDRAKYSAHRLLDGQQSRHFGERPPGLRDQLRTYGLEAALALQWRESALSAHYAGKNLAPEQFLEIRFEDILTDPNKMSNTIVDFLCDEFADKPSCGIFHAANKDKKFKWKNLDHTFFEKIEMHIRPTLEFFKYVW